MDPVVTVDTDTLSVEPGGQASVTVHIRNRSSIVEGFRLDVLGEAAPWARGLPDHVEGLPQGEAGGTGLFAPPPGGTPTPAPSTPNGSPCAGAQQTHPPRAGPTTSHTPGQDPVPHRFAVKPYQGMPLLRVSTLSDRPVPVCRVPCL